jgi:hypothetical protein
VKKIPECETYLKISDKGGMSSAFAAGTPTQNKSKAPKKGNDPTMCQFCGIKDKEFAIGENLDLHYVNECMLLTQCPGCTQVIEVATLTGHLGAEC